MGRFKIGAKLVPAPPFLAGDFEKLLSLIQPQFVHVQSGYLLRTSAMQLSKREWEVLSV